jgi:nucleoside-diphosphate-sugar epimerase
MIEAPPPEGFRKPQRRLGRVLITGSRGFIGGMLARTLLQTGESVVTSDLGDGGTVATDFQACDISDAGQVDALFRGDTFATIFHCGAISGPMVKADRPLEIWRTNALGTAHLLEAVRRQGAGRFVLCSSCSVYGSTNGMVIDEDTVPDPGSVYGASKLAAEQAMIGYGREHGVEAVSLRLSWVYGPGRRTRTNLERLVRASLGDRTVEIEGAPNEFTHYVHVEDVVAGLIAAASACSSPRQIYNISAGDGVPMSEVVAIVRALAPDLEVTFTNRSSSDAGQSGFSLVNARNDLGYHPRIALAEGLRRFREALRTIEHD